MRLLLAVSLLSLVACSSKASPSDAQGQTDTGAETGTDTTSMDAPVEQPNDWAGFPKCVFTSGDAGSAQCNLSACLYPDGGVDPSGCWPCPDGYACAILCPTPLGGCGPPSLCCPVN